MKDLIDKTLRVAVASDLPVKLIYQGKEQITQRVIEVKSINDTHVVAFCRKKRQVRTFRLDSILAAQIVSAKKK